MLWPLSNQTLRSPAGRSTWRLPRCIFLKTCKAWFQENGAKMQSFFTSSRSSQLSQVSPGRFFGIDVLLLTTGHIFRLGEHRQQVFVGTDGWIILRGGPFAFSHLVLNMYKCRGCNVKDLQIFRLTTQSPHQCRS